MANRLIHESSPYLAQHAHNPVDWYPWGEEALERAVKEDKPILVSIGYAACHWCHVMERESFEDAAVAAVMNEYFINIKIDREERPDLDHIYMEALQAMTGSGGWPLNVFLTPDKKPFYGGTYFPPSAAYNRASWMDVLLSVAQAFREKRAAINEQAENLTRHILSSNDFGQQPGAADDAFSKKDMDAAFVQIMKTADRSRGGFGRAPKFPQTFTIRFLLHYYAFTGNQEALDQACLSLDKMIFGGIYDQLGGGFARYSTDEYWLAPHFEKMLYDNALLTITLSEAYQITAKPLYLQTVMHTLDFVERELRSPENGFYAALDADSEGVEGKFYVWDKKEIDELLDPQADLFNEYYQVEPGGNWEHVNILHRTQSEDDFAVAKNLDPAWLKETLQKGRETLLARRSQRIRPLLDDKILLGWNSLMNIAYSKAYAATGMEKYREMAIANMDFLLSRLQGAEEGDFFHSFKDGISKYPAFLDDYALLIQALIHLQEVTGNPAWLQKVKTLVKYVITHFSEPETGYFYFTNDRQKDVIVRKKELFDSAVPSGNSLMAWNLYYAGVIFDIPAWRQRAVKMGGAIKQTVQKYPGSFGNWATFMLSVSYGIPEIVLTGKNYDNILKEILRIFIPFRIFQSSPAENSEFPLLAGKSFSLSPKIYLCKNFTCQSPVTEVDKLRYMLESPNKYNV